MAIIHAMEKAGSPEPSKYLAALKSESFPGVTGTIAFDAKGDIKEAVTVYQFKDGAWVACNRFRSCTYRQDPGPRPPRVAALSHHRTRMMAFAFHGIPRQPTRAKRVHRCWTRRFLTTFKKKTSDGNLAPTASGTGWSSAASMRWWPWVHDGSGIPG